MIEHDIPTERALSSDIRIMKTGYNLTSFLLHKFVLNRFILEYIVFGIMNKYKPTYVYMYIPNQI